MRDLLADGARRLAEAGIESARLDARLLLAHALGIPPDELVGNSPLRLARAHAVATRRSLDTSPVTTGEERSSTPSVSSPVYGGGVSSVAADETEGGIVARFDSLIARRATGEPLAYIVGHKEFWSLEFEVGPGALVPRPDSETLIEQALKLYPDRTEPLEVLDLGTGTGCLLIALLSEYPNARGTGIDASEQALDWARRTLARHGLEARCRLIAGDWARARGPADVILANPPYVRSDKAAALARFEPLAALDGGADGLEAYRALAPRIAPLLKPKGCAFFELGAGQAEAVAAIMQARMLEIAGIAADLAGVERCMVVAKSGAGR